MKPDKNTKEFGLTDNESMMLDYIARQQAGIFSMLLTHIATSRLAYHVTQNTQFQLSPDYKSMLIVEMVNEASPIVTAEDKKDEHSSDKEVRENTKQDQNVQERSDNDNDANAEGNSEETKDSEPAIELDPEPIKFKKKDKTAS